MNSGKRESLKEGVSTESPVTENSDNIMSKTHQLDLPRMRVVVYLDMNAI